jgi:hypothetical protein
MATIVSDFLFISLSVGFRRKERTYGAFAHIRFARQAAFCLKVAYFNGFPLLIYPSSCTCGRASLLLIGQKTGFYLQGSVAKIQGKVVLKIAPY